MTEAKDPVISLRNVSKYYRLYERKADRVLETFHPMGRQYHEKFYALRNVDLQVGKGEILGVMGQNGCGKSTLMKVISNILTPSAGSVRVSGHIVPLLELGAGFNPEFTGLENIYFYNSIHGFSHAQTDAMLDSIIAFAEIGKFIHQPLRTYSSGMKSRLAFAVSINIEPDILILDEVLSVGDERFRRKCFTVMESFFQGGKTILFVSHSKSSIFTYCTRAILMHQGEIILDGPAKLVSTLYAQHIHAAKELLPETLASIRAIDADEALKAAIYEEIDQMHANAAISDSPGGQSLTFPAVPKTVPGRADAFDRQETEGLVESWMDKQPNFLIAKPAFLDNLVPTSTIITGQPHIRITDIRITTPEGVPVNQLVTGDTYHLAFRLQFTADEEKLFWFFAIKLPNGFEIFQSQPRGSSRKSLPTEVAAGFDRTIRWEFTCNLLRGNYFLDVGIKRPELKHATDLYRISDALLFKVRTPTTYSEKGMAFLQLKEPTVEEVRAD